ISIVHDFPLNITKSLKIVRVANEYFLLGVSQDNVNLITRIEDKESIDLFKLESSRAVPAKGFFQDLLERYLPKGMGQTIKQSPLDITKNLKERLSKMKK
ncbi:MAG: flagellar biosynthetic protein FliO, partial [Spirochaetia bacterium]|nr:flagellar biosynthetic protein FliO [Spirochaetia bacterium]